MFSPTSSGKSQTAPVSKSFHCHRTFRSHQIFRTCCTFHTHRNFKISRLYKEMIIKFIAQIHIFYFHFIVSEIQIQFCKPFFVFCVFHTETCTTNTHPVAKTELIVIVLQILVRFGCQIIHIRRGRINRCIQINSIIKP